MRIPTELARSSNLNLFFQVVLLATALFMLSLVTSSDLMPAYPGNAHTKNSSANVENMKSNEATPTTGNETSVYHIVNNTDIPSHGLREDASNKSTILILTPTSSFPIPAKMVDSETDRAEKKDKALLYRKQRDLNARKKVEKVGGFLAMFVIGVGGWWWAAEILRNAVI